MLWTWRDRNTWVSHTAVSRLDVPGWPSTPRWPTPPVNPVAPCGPGDPRSPEGPCWPFVPTVPLRPMAPCRPRSPSLPDAPITPGWPTTPCRPPGPGAPAPSDRPINEAIQFSFNYVEQRAGVKQPLMRPLDDILGLISGMRVLFSTLTLLVVVVLLLYCIELYRYCTGWVTERDAFEPVKSTANYPPTILFWWVTTEQKASWTDTDCVCEYNTMQ